VQIFDDYPQAHYSRRAQVAEQVDAGQHLRLDLFLTEDPDSALGLEPFQVFDHTTREWTAEWRAVIEWRCWRAGIQPVKVLATRGPCDTDPQETPDRVIMDDPQ
jgi:hypothetical protein